MANPVAAVAGFDPGGGYKKSSNAPLFGSSGSSKPAPTRATSPLGSTPAGGSGPVSGGISYGPSPTQALSNLLSGSGGGGGGGAAPAIQTTPLVNTAQKDPGLTEFTNSIKDRIGTMQGREGQGDPNLQTQVDRLGNRMSSDTRQRAQDFAAQDINARARANQTMLKEQLARRGIRGDSGLAIESGQKIQETAQREAARSAAGIGLADETRQDALTLGGQQIMSAPGQYGLAREGMTNSLFPAQLQGASTQAATGLADRNLNLNQWQAANDFALRGNEQALNAETQRLANVLAFTKLGIGNQI